LVRIVPTLAIDVARERPGVVVASTHPGSLLAAHPEVPASRNGPRVRRRIVADL